MFRQKCITVAALFVLGAIPPVHAQSIPPAFTMQWENRIDRDSPYQQHEINDIAVAPDGSVYAVGYRENPNTYEDDGWVMHFDAEGNLLWEVVWGYEGTDRFESIALAPDGGIYAVGHSESDTLPGTSRGWVLYIKDQEIMWSKTYTGAGFSLWSYLTGVSNHHDIFYAAAPAPDGGVYAAGYTEGEAVPDAWLMRLDSDGNEIWDVVTGGENWDQFLDIAPAPNGGVYVGGDTSRDNEGQDAWILHFDVDGNALWSEFSETTGGYNSRFVYDVEPTADGDLALVGYDDTDGITNGWFAKLDAYGDISVQSLTGPADTWVAFHDMAIAPDNSIYAVGYYEAYISNKSAGYLAHLDAAGNLLRDQIVPIDGDLNALAPAPDGGFYIAGTVKNPETYGSAALLMHMVPADQ